MSKFIGGLRRAQTKQQLSTRDQIQKLNLIALQYQLNRYGLGRTEKQAKIAHILIATQLTTIQKVSCMPCFLLTSVNTKRENMCQDRLHMEPKVWTQSVGSLPGDLPLPKAKPPNIVGVKNPYAHKAMAGTAFTTAKTSFASKGPVLALWWLSWRDQPAAKSCQRALCAHLAHISMPICKEAFHSRMDYVHMWRKKDLV